MKRIALVVLLLTGGARAAQAQDNTQITAAVAPLPEEFRATATVLGHTAGKTELGVLRQGSGPFKCLADEPGDERFHVACYHKSLEPFMARGRALRAQKIANVDSVRFAEIQAKKLDMPSQPAALYSLTGKAADVGADGIATGARRLYVVYIPFATAESTGLSTKPQANLPWIMNAGTPKAHIMFVPGM